MTFARQTFGKAGEDLAVAELERRGYEITARRYRTRHGEIDIVARDGETVVFVEVKARTTAEFGTAAEAVTRAKQRRLVRMAIEYIAHNDIRDVPLRFDVVAIDGSGDSARIAVYPHAFEA
jgi:putative endonuclease